MALNLELSDNEVYEFNDALNEVITRMVEKGQTPREIEFGSLRVLWGLQLRLTEAKFGTRSIPGLEQAAPRVEEAILNPKRVASR